MKLRLNKRSGFTLIEIMLVVVIIGMLVTMVGMNLIKPRKQAYVTTAQNQINSYKMALQSYSLDNGIFPTSEQGLQSLIAPPNSEPVPTKWHGPYLDPAVVKPDPWNRPYNYVCPAQQNPDPEGFDLYSSGPDGRPNTDDDIVSWR
ncbi:MAG: type II secretion system major pseudopilin GspG [Verrucomicrobia bacterium]|nr:type II secretion system major pseudopilin GspG [Verrucomicrobiota bacterium]